MLFNQHIADLVYILEKCGIRHVTICPGSRNAPLIQGFTRNDHFTCHSIVDERSAGYVALGMARDLGECVAVVTTSGTAALNLYPAVAEAFHQKVPLLLLTADRPPEWPPQFNNQIIDQQGIFSGNAKAYYNIPFSVTDADLAGLYADLKTIVDSAAEDICGPVHINVQLDEPLYDKLPDRNSEDAIALDFSKGIEKSVQSISVRNRKLISDQLNEMKKVMILAGMKKYSTEEKYLLESISTYFQVVVIAENITNLFSELFIGNPELIIGSMSELESGLLTPDLILSFGGQVVSKNLKKLVNRFKDLDILSLENVPADLFRNLTPGREVLEENKFLQLWKSAERISVAKSQKFMETAPFCNLTVAGRIMKAIPEDAVVHLGNSSIIRYSQLFPDWRKLAYYGNRGTSGIDGCLSSAVGAAMVSDKLHVALMGDLSFVYDSNGMWNKDFPDNIRIIVLNDGGGGIFRIIQGPDRMPFYEEFSVTHHPVSLQLLAEAFGLKYRISGDFDSLEKGLENIFEKDLGACVMEVETSKSENSAIFRKFFNSLKDQ